MKAITCDNCGVVLRLDHQSGTSDSNGELSAWIRLGGQDGPWFDACTRQCAHELLDGALGQAVDAQAEMVAEIARTIREDRERDIEEPS